MKRYCTFAILLLVFFSCGDAGINNKSKRNESWICFKNGSTGEESWIPITQTMPVKTGTYTRFYATGELMETGQLKDSVHVDTARIYDKSGNCIQYKIFETGKKDRNYYTTDGPFKRYYSTGEIWYEGTVKNHAQEGLWKEYSIKGKLNWQENLINGAGWGSLYYENGGLKDSAYHVNGIQQGLYKLWYPNGQQKQITNWKDNVQDGEQFYFHENGQLLAKETWADGKIQGKRNHYYENGNMKSDALYINGKTHGIQKKFHENGRLRCEGLMLAGKQSGDWLWYDENGSLYQKDICKDGVVLKVEKY